eukprot:jgi/Psemu1/66766/estExt_Genemark1.C_2380032
MKPIYIRLTLKQIFVGIKRNSPSAWISRAIKSLRSQDILLDLLKTEVPGKVLSDSISRQQAKWLLSCQIEKPNFVDPQRTPVRMNEGDTMDVRPPLYDPDQVADPVNNVSDKDVKADDATMSQAGPIPGKPPLQLHKASDRLRFKWALKQIQFFCLIFWKRKVKHGFLTWFQAGGLDHSEDKEIFLDGLAACQKANKASWWNWDNGSSTFFWRWPSDYQTIARKGIIPMFNSDPPKNRDLQPPYDDKETRTMVKDKLNNVIGKDLQKYCEVDLTQLVDRNTTSKRPLTVGACMQNAMGLKLSPYNSDGLPASEICQYVDDVQIIMATEEIAWRCSSWMVKGLSWLGLQEAARKHREPSQQPGAWAGATICTNRDFVKVQVCWIANQLGLCNRHSLGSFGELEEKVSQDKPQPERHIHYKTTKLCQENRSPDGWPCDSRSGLAPAATPHKITSVAPKPSCKEPSYIVDGASGPGFDSSLWSALRDQVAAIYGAWTTDASQKSSSNFCESENLVQCLRQEVLSGRIKQGSEVFVFMDDAVGESTMYKGSSKSKPLHELVLGLRKLAMTGDAKRMIWQGTDGLSPGDFSSRVMAGNDFLKLLPLHQTCLKQLPPPKDLVRGWCPKTKGIDWKFTKPKDWFDLCVVKDIFPQSKHIFLCPATRMTGVWRKQLLKLADSQLTVVNGSKPWPKDMFEPLIIALVAPPLSSLDRGKWERQHAWGRNGSIRCKGGCFPVLSLRDLDNSLINESLLEDEDPTRFKEATNGDHLMTAFQCDLCHFVNIKGRCPLSDNHSDQLLLMCIRRAILLDSFWSRERSTVQANLSKAKHFVDTLETFGIKEKAFPHQGPYPQVDSWGVSLMGADGSISVATEAPTNKPWFKRFILGCHNQCMGDHCKGDPVKRKFTSLQACLFISGIYGDLRGEELNRVDLGGIRKCWNESLRAFGDKWHVPLVLSRTFKREVGLKLYKQLLTCVTKRNIDICLWFSQALKAYKDEGTFTGPLFGNRRTPQLFRENIDVTGAFNTYRSLRRGSTAEAQNAKIPKEVIEANNRWRKFAQRNSGAVGLSMMDRYLDAKASSRLLNLKAQGELVKLPLIRPTLGNRKDPQSEALWKLAVPRAYIGGCGSAQLPEATGYTPMEPNTFEREITALKLTTIRAGFPPGLM